MSELQYISQLDILFNDLQLGKRVSLPEPIPGGLLHKMFSVETIKGKCAIKVLNPKIMLRPTAMQNYINSENIAAIAAKYIPAAPAIAFGGKAIQEIDGQYYLVFDYIYGKSLFGNDINTSHCEQIIVLMVVMNVSLSY